LHLDLAAAQFLNDKLFVGAVGYVYQQLTADRGGFVTRIFTYSPQRCAASEKALTIRLPDLITVSRSWSPLLADSTMEAAL
jgi:hypothetical protein